MDLELRIADIERRCTNMERQQDEWITKANRHLDRLAQDAEQRLLKLDRLMRTMDNIMADRGYDDATT